MTRRLSQDGALMVTAGGIDRSARSWDVHTGRQLAVIDGGERSVSGAGLVGHDMVMVGMSGPADGAAELWDWRRRQLVTRFPEQEGSLADATVSPNGRSVAIVSDGANRVRVHEINTGKIVVELRGPPQEALLDAAFSPDGTMLATSGTGNSVQHWEVGTGRSVGDLRGHRGGINSMAFSQDGTHIVTTSEDRTVRIWKVASRETIAVLQGSEDRVISAAFTQDGGSFVVAGSTGGPFGMDHGTARIVTCQPYRPVEELVRLACARLTRGFTQAEQASFLPADRRRSARSRSPAGCGPPAG